MCLPTQSRYPPSDPYRPPGVGKTRLALRAVEELVGNFPDGVCFVPLAPVTRADLFLSTLALALGVQEGTDRPLLQRLQEHLSTGDILLLQDNCEQLEAPAAQIAALLAAVPGLKIVATSLTLLHVYGEHEFRTKPLELPQAWHLHLSSDADLAAFSEIESVALFAERARAANPDFRLTCANAPSIAALCTRLDGLPIALELAAVRTTIFSPEATLAQMEHRFDFLKSGARDLPARHQTLSAAIDWSYDLLTPDEQRLLNRLSVFAGGCSLGAANAVANLDRRSSALQPVQSCENPPPYVETALLDALLDALVDHNLLAVHMTCDDVYGYGSEGLRFSMLETVRECALRRLDESGEGIVPRILG